MILRCVSLVYICIYIFGPLRSGGGLAAASRVQERCSQWFV